MQYQITKKRMIDDQGAGYTGYGIRAGLLVAHDISLSRKEVEELVDLMNHHQLALCHFWDVLEDYLSK